MENIKDAGATGKPPEDEWYEMNERNKARMREWRRGPHTQVNVGRQIGVQMAEWVE